MLSDKEKKKLTVLQKIAALSRELLELIESGDDIGCVVVSTDLERELVRLAELEALNAK